MQKLRFKTKMARIEGSIYKFFEKFSKTDYLIECYLDNSLTKKERIQFEKDLKTR